jgi:uncharacterized membrane protein YqjE
MASVHRLPAPAARPDDDTSSADGRDRPRPRTADGSIATRLMTLAKLELELGLAETREVVVSAAIAVALAIPALVLLLASLVVLIAAAFAPLFRAPWQHLLIAGGGVALLAVATLAWSAWRLTHLSWPKETVASLQENWRWLGAQLRSRLTLHAPGR